MGISFPVRIPRTLAKSFYRNGLRLRCRPRESTAITTASCHRAVAYLGRCLLCASQRRVDHMLRDEPDLQLVAPNHVADHEVVRPIVARGRMASASIVFMVVPPIERQLAGIRTTRASRCGARRLPLSGVCRVRMSSSHRVSFRRVFRNAPPPLALRRLAEDRQRPAELDRQPADAERHKEPRDHRRQTADANSV